MKRELSCSYLYTDGTLVQTFDEKRDNVVICQTVDITLGFCALEILRREGSSVFGKSAVPNGRIILHRYETEGLLQLLKGGKVQATMPSLNGGSEKTREMGIKVQYVSVRTARGLKFDWCETPEILGGTFCIQEVTVDQSAHATMTPGMSWGGSRVWKVKDLRKEVAASVAA